MLMFSWGSTGGATANNTHKRLGISVKVPTWAQLLLCFRDKALCDFKHHLPGMIQATTDGWCCLVLVSATGIAVHRLTPSTPQHQPAWPTSPSHNRTMLAPTTQSCVSPLFPTL